ncbi:Peptidase S10, serine carboxypeptidase [Penicillium camemberti]|uniref:Peptidase S10, serine carboxypeptidase n=1 Tax=Penicillium camemberti (strain FM 013) TaxID=1429867 RepID=A0A0G4PIZ3_PENC3|nr:Peptidase S10, serine carboxypeptidase [Penicillium camemberti]
MGLVIWLLRVVQKSRSTFRRDGSVARRSLAESLG